MNHTINVGLVNRFPNPQYGVISPLLSQSKRNCWDDLKKFTSCFPRRDTNENELRVDIWRTEKDRIRIQLFGADNPDALNGYRMDGSIMDEAQDHSPEFFGKTVRPMLSDRRGWALFTGTVRGRNYFWKLRQRYREKMISGDPNYFEAEYKASQTGVIPQEELDSAREEMGDDLYMQEYELSAESANKGSYYGQLISEAEKEGRIGSVPYDPSVPVDLWFDLGIDDTMAIWFIQHVRREIHAIDYMEGSGIGIPEWCGKIRQKPYSYDQIKLPHDAAARELGTGKTREEIFKSQGFHRTRITPRQTLADGIQAVRSILPRCWIDRIKCEKGIDALKEYQREWDDKNQVFKDAPKHNWASHPADAFRTGAMSLRESITDQRNLPETAEMEYDILG